MLRLLLGLIKGVAIGGAVGFGAYSIGMSGGLNWITYGLVGALVGLLVGRPLWSHIRDRSSTVYTAALKGIFGFGIGCGIYALVGVAWGTFDLSLLDETRRAHNWQFIMGGAIGALWGAFVELDDAPEGDDEKS